jgi:FAD/FMN-containing dehydrogenase
MTSPSQPAPAGVDRLAAACAGDVLGPQDDGYADACLCWNRWWTHRPAVVVRAASEADVVAAVRHAAEHGLGVAVQATGHGVTATADEGCVLILTEALDDVRVDPQARTATIGAGATWAPVLAAAQAHGLAPLLGSAPHVGAVGYTLGGGFGWLARRHGLAVDRVRSLRVVLADGRVVTASHDEEPELLWALCGGGAGSLGVVVEMTVELAEVGEVYAGSLLYPLEVAVEAFDRYRDWSARAPEELTSGFNITAFPPLEVIPEPLRGQRFVIVRGCHAGGAEAGAALVDEWRAWRQPAMDLCGPLPFTRSGEISQDPIDPVPAGTSGRWLHGLDPSVLEAMLDVVVGGDGPSPMLFAELRQAGGAVARPNPAASFAARDAAYSLQLAGIAATPEAGDELQRRFAATWTRLAPALTDTPGYLNFLEGPERVQTTSAAFDDATWQRLADVKRRYDPDGLFRCGVPLASE